MFSSLLILFFFMLESWNKISHWKCLILLSSYTSIHCSIQYIAYLYINLSLTTEPIKITISCDSFRLFCRNLDRRAHPLVHLHRIQRKEEGNIGLQFKLDLKVLWQRYLIRWLKNFNAELGLIDSLQIVSKRSNQ